MRPASPTIAIIARELALRTIELSFPPEAIHTPGVAPVMADKFFQVHVQVAAAIAKTFILLLQWLLRLRHQIVHPNGTVRYIVKPPMNRQCGS